MRRPTHGAGASAVCGGTCAHAVARARPTTAATVPEMRRNDVEARVAHPGRNRDISRSAMSRGQLLSIHLERERHLYPLPHQAAADSCRREEGMRECRAGGTDERIVVIAHLSGETWAARRPHIVNGAVLGVTRRVHHVR